MVTFLPMRCAWTSNFQLLMFFPRLPTSPTAVPLLGAMVSADVVDVLTTEDVGLTPSTAVAVLTSLKMQLLPLGPHVRFVANLVTLLFADTIDRICPSLNRLSHHSGNSLHRPTIHLRFYQLRNLGSPTLGLPII
jgi:hypothetical protein